MDAAGAHADRHGVERVARAPPPARWCSAPTTRRRWASRGERVILVRRETTPDDYHGMIASQGILTSAGGTNSHAAVVARGEGIPAVCGADAIKLEPRGEDVHGRTAPRSPRATSSRSTASPATCSWASCRCRSRCWRRRAQGDAAAREETLWKAFAALMAHADVRRRLRVRANADTPEQSTNARERGAEGIGLCRTEHMFLGEERVLAVRQMIFAETAAGGAGRVRRPAAAAARRLRGDLPRHERAAGHGAAARSAAARVPAGPGRARGRGRAGRGARRGREPSRSASCRR